MGAPQSSLKAQPEPGDLIEIFREMYCHWAIYVGDGKVIHWDIPGGPPGLFSSILIPFPRKGRVKKEPLSTVVGWAKYRVHHKQYDDNHNGRSRRQVLCDAEALVGKEVACERPSCELSIIALLHGDLDSGQEENLELGDLIEIFRGPYSHWAVYVGDREVVHLTVPDGASGVAASSVPSGQGKNGLVKKEPLSVVMGGGKYRINNKYDRRFGHKDRLEIVRDAEGMVGKWVPYSLLGNNCEHFATGLRHGVRVSDQVDAAEKTLIAGGGTSLGLGASMMGSPLVGSLVTLASMTSASALNTREPHFGPQRALQRR